MNTSTPTPPETPVLDPTEQAALIRKVTLRLIPFLFLLYVVAYLDRVNVSIAHLQMADALKISEAAYGTGAGIFFLGYFCFEVPSNLMLARFGARRWIARIMVTWGVLAMMMAFIGTFSNFLMNTCHLPAAHPDMIFYIMRFFLGIGEAGFFPGVILYLTFWFTRAERGRIVALFMTATVISNIIGGPISGALLSLKGFGLAGWQWLFLIEGVPAVALAFVVLAYLPNGPQDARWLSQSERDWLTIRLQNEDHTMAAHGHSLSDVITHPRVLLMSLLYLGIVITNYGYQFFLPDIIKTFGKHTSFEISCLSTIPYLFAVVGMVLVGNHSDRHRERRLHVACSSLVGCIGLTGAALTLHQPVLCMAFLSFAAIGMWSTLGPFWGLSTAFLAGTGAAGAIALINSIGNLGGYFGPSIMGYLKTHTRDFQTGILMLALSSLIAALIAFSIKKESTTP